MTNTKKRTPLRGSWGVSPECPDAHCYRCSTPRTEGRPNRRGLRPLEGASRDARSVSSSPFDIDCDIPLFLPDCQVRPTLTRRSLRLRRREPLRWDFCPNSQPNQRLDQRNRPHFDKERIVS